MQSREDELRQQAVLECCTLGARRPTYGGKRLTEPRVQHHGEIRDLNGRRDGSRIRRTNVPKPSTRDQSPVSSPHVLWIKKP